MSFKGLRVLLTAFSMLLTLASQSQEITWEDLESQGAVIGRIEFRVIDVFDTSKADESHFLGRAANFIHITTKVSVVSRELLFKTGEAVDARRIRETERNLRAYPYIWDAHITPVVEEDGTVTARVHVQDAWSLKLGAKYKHAGGETEWGVRLHEVNFLGYGKKLQFSYESVPERITEKIAYLDPRLFGTRWTLEANYQNLSDGRARLLKLERPFFSLDTRWSAGVYGMREESDITLYNQEQEAWLIPSVLDKVSLGGRWAYALKGDTAFRLGLEYRSDQARYGDPLREQENGLPAPVFEDRRLRGPVLHWGMVQDRYETGWNQVGIGRTEDWNLGWELDLGLGFFGPAFGGRESAVYGEMELSKAWSPGEKNLLVLASWFEGRRQEGTFRDTFTNTRLTFYNQSLPLQTLVVSAAVDGGTRPAPENWLYLGGEDGFRGYPNHFLAGDRRWSVTVEDRIITQMSLWGLLQVGFVAYADLGAIRRFDTGLWSKTYADVGLGLRFGNLKSSYGSVLTLTVAVPLVKEPGMDSYQIVFGNTFSF